ncbi:MAG: ATP-dependent DNA ligase [candidate division WOR-3 bacterium]
MYFSEIIHIYEKVKEKSSLKDKIFILSDFFEKLSLEEIKISFSLLSGIPLYGKLNVGYSLLREVLASIKDFSVREIELKEIEEFIKKLSFIKGEGSLSQRFYLLKDFFKNLNEKERAFFVDYLIGEVRQGAKEKIIFKALLKAKRIDIKEGEKLLKRGNILELVYEIFEKGNLIFKEFNPKIFEPLSPMLAEIEEDPLRLFKKGKNFLLEFKLDGARLQIHKERDKIKIFSRNLKDITFKLKNLTEFFKGFKRDFILDAEGVILNEEGNPIPFQDFMKEFGKKYVESENISPFVFDILYVDGEFLLDYPLKERKKILEEIIPEKIKMPYIITDKKDEAENFFLKSIEKGNEGLIIKDPVSPYTYGKRGKYWFKWKKFYTLDLVITGAEWGHGKRRGFLSNLHLSCLDEERKNFLDLGKTFKGLKEEDLIFLTKNLPPLTEKNFGWMIKVKPFYVVEVAFDEVIESKVYNSGFSLRFARVKRFRFDKSAHDIADIKEIRRIFLMERNI